MPDPLREQAEQFADELTTTLRGSLPDAPDAFAETHGDRVVVRPQRDVPLLVKGQELAKLEVTIRCQIDSAGRWLAVESSKFVIAAKLDSTPIFRFEYVRRPVTCPSAHVQIHAHRGALTHLLSRANHDKPHDISALHIPVGGARFRPCVEDVIEFAVADCGFDSLKNWREAVNAGRARWRRIQAKAVVRDFPAEAAEVLRDAYGYDVRPPVAGHPESGEKALHDW